MIPQTNAPRLMMPLPVRSAHAWSHHACSQKILTLLTLPLLALLLLAGPARAQFNGGDGRGDAMSRLSDWIEEIPELVSLSYPEANQSDVPLLFEFAWSETERAAYYHFQLATDEFFDGIIVDVAGLATNSLALTDSLAYLTGYWWRVRAVNSGGAGPWCEPRAFITMEAKETSGERQDRQRPAALELHQNYPNPFNPSTRIRFALPQDGHVTLTVHSVIGQRAATLVDGHRGAGWHDVVFDAAQLSSGVYILRMEAGQDVLIRSMTLIR